jgi:hypothetical protein
MNKNIVLILYILIFFLILIIWFSGEEFLDNSEFDHHISHYSIFDFRQRKFRQQLNNRSQKGFKQRFLRCCQGFTNSQISCTKSLPLCFGQRFNKRGHKKPLPLCFWQRYEKRRQKQLLPIDLCYGL